MWVVRVETPTSRGDLGYGETRGLCQLDGVVKDHTLKSHVTGDDRTEREECQLL